jgi:carbamoyl-phosphate synthase large subunit
MRLGFSDQDIHGSCKIDPWFLAEIRGLVETEAQIGAKGLPTTAGALRRLKAMGFSDARLGKLTGMSAETVTQKRRALGVRPSFKRIDSCAAEFASPTPYMYSTYAQPFAGTTVCEAAPSDKNKIVILGGGPNRIGQGIEFDYCCCHAAFALKEAGYETIMVNCNPETVSTDYDTSDRLYFEPLTAEDVLEIIETERSSGHLHGVIVQFGGQTPLKLAEALERAEIPILGTSPDMIDLAEDRDRFKKLLNELGLRQPTSGIATSPTRHAHRRGGRLSDRDPAILRARRSRHGDRVRCRQLDRYLARLANDLDRPSELVVSQKRPLLIDRYLSDAIEVDVDCLADGKDATLSASWST